jgi:uncharacterized protein YybS (DUF2232 family)
LLGFRQQRISALAIHCREIKRDSPAVVLLCQTLFFEVGQITADSISRNLQLFCKLSNTGLPCSLRISMTYFCLAVLCMFLLILQNVAINRILQHFAEREYQMPGIKPDIKRRGLFGIQAV